MRQSDRSDHKLLKLEQPSLQEYPDKRQQNSVEGIQRTRLLNVDDYVDDGVDDVDVDVCVDDGVGDHDDVFNVHVDGHYNDYDDGDDADDDDDADDGFDDDDDDDDG